MLNEIEEIVMVNQIKDSAKIKHVESDNRLKTKQHTSKDPVMDTGFLSDTLNFSNTFKQLEVLKASLKDIPEINEARVLYFKAEIESGNYQINSDRIAMNMLNVEMA